MKHLFSVDLYLLKQLASFLRQIAGERTVIAKFLNAMASDYECRSRQLVMVRISSRRRSHSPH